MYLKKTLTLLLSLLLLCSCLSACGKNNVIGFYNCIGHVKVPGFELVVVHDVDGVGSGTGSVFVNNVDLIHGSGYTAAEEKKGSSKCESKKDFFHLSILHKILTSE